MAWRSVDVARGGWNTRRMNRPLPSPSLLALGGALLVSGCASLLSLDEFDESSASGGAGGDASQDADAEAAAVACSLDVTPVYHNFGPIPVGQVSSPVRFTVSNPQDVPVGPLVLWGGDPPNPNFSITAQTCQDATLDPGASCTVDFVFAPQALGKYLVPLVVKVGDVECAKVHMEAGAPPT